MSQFREREAIGGYFALDRGGGSGLAWMADATGYRSARAGLAAVLASARPKAVWVPHYLCGAVDEALRAADVRVRRYPLTETLGVPDEISPDATDLVLCVDYFGISSPGVDRAIKRFGVDRVLVDASQSLFHLHRPGCTTVYSPRKFLGVPDGGLVLTSRRLSARSDADEADSVTRSQHLLYRLAGMVEGGFIKFQEAEESLAGCEPIALSRLTEAMLRSIDTETVAASRVRNYDRLTDALRPAGFAVQRLAPGAVPLCCPVRCDNAINVRRKLATQRIFTPTYWPDATIPDDDFVGRRLRDNTVYLPCDQRYGEIDMSRVASVLIESVEVL